MPISSGACGKPNEYWAQPKPIPKKKGLWVQRSKLVWGDILSSTRKKNQSSGRSSVGRSSVGRASLPPPYQTPSPPPVPAHHYHEHTENVVVTKKARAPPPPKPPSSSPCDGCCGGGSSGKGCFGPAGMWGGGGYAGGHGGCCGSSGMNDDWYTDDTRLRRRRCLACLFGLLIMLLLLALILALIFGIAASTASTTRTNILSMYPGGTYLQSGGTYGDVYVYPVTSGPDQAYLVYREPCNDTASPVPATNDTPTLPNCDVVSTQLVPFTNFSFPATTTPKIVYLYAHADHVTTAWLHLFITVVLTIYVNGMFVI